MTQFTQLQEYIQRTFNRKGEMDAVNIRNDSLFDTVAIDTGTDILERGTTDFFTGAGTKAKALRNMNQSHQLPEQMAIRVKGVMLTLIPRATAVLDTEFANLIKNAVLTFKLQSTEMFTERVSRLIPFQAELADHYVMAYGQPKEGFGKVLSIPGVPESGYLIDKQEIWIYLELEADTTLTTVSYIMLDISGPIISQV